MVDDLNNQDFLIPENSCLLHIGPAKTGTTMLQNAFMQSRKEMQSQGVFYPGKSRSHGKAMRAFLDHMEGKGAKPIKPWKKLVRQIYRTSENRLLISHETVASASPATAKKLIDSIGFDHVHIAITLRPKAEILPSSWYQGLKKKRTQTLESWLQSIYNEGTTPLDQGGLVERWAQIVGPKNVTVIIADKHNKTLSIQSFENLLGLKSDTLTGTVQGRKKTNRSMSMLEAEVLRRINMHVNECDYPEHLYRRLIHSGMVRGMLKRSMDQAEEPSICIPRWAANRATEDSKQYAERIHRSGVRVIGNLEDLYSEPSVAEDQDGLTGEEFERTVSIATHALCGAIDAAAIYWPSNLAARMLSRIGKISAYREWRQDML